MNLCRFLPRLWLACHALVWLVPGVARAEVKVLDRKAVVGGAEVVLALISDDGPATYYQYSYREPGGEAQVFYRMVVRLLGPDGLNDFLKPWRATKIDTLKFDEHRVSLFLPDECDCVVVTLEIHPAAARRVYVDRFLQSYGYLSCHAELLGVDELELTDPAQRWLETKKLRRAADGSWLLAGIPYEKNAWSTVFTLPLPPLHEMLKQEAQAAGEGGMSQGGWTSLQPLAAPVAASRQGPAAAWHVPPLSAIAMNDPAPQLPNTFIKGLLTMDDLFGVPAFVAKMERVRRFPAFIKPRRAASDPAPALSLWLDSRLSALSVRLPSGERSVDCGLMWLNDYVLIQGWFQRGIESSRTVVGELPCYGSAYDQAVKDLLAAYLFCEEYYSTHLAKSMRGPYDAGFMPVIERRLRWMEE